VRFFNDILAIVSRPGLFVYISCVCLLGTIVRSSVTRTPQTEKAAMQASSKITDKVPGAVIMVDEEKENSSGELSSPVAPLAVQESFDERAKPATTPATTTTSVPTSTKDNSPRVVIVSLSNFRSNSDLNFPYFI
jgi:hypothetical protein